MLKVEGGKLKGMKEMICLGKVGQEKVGRCKETKSGHIKKPSLDWHIRKNLAWNGIFERT